MAIITAAGLANLSDSFLPFNKNGSVVTLKKISETHWLLFGDIAEGDSEGFPLPPPLFCPLATDWNSDDGVTFPVILGQPVRKPVMQYGVVSYRWVDFEYDAGEVIGNTPLGIPPYIESINITHDNEVGTFSVNIRMSNDFILGDTMWARVRFAIESMSPLPPSVTSAYLTPNQTATFLMPGQVNNGIAGEGDTVCVIIEYAPLT